MEGPVLVTGGAGFFGFHLIGALLIEPRCRPIVSVSRSPKSNLHDDVEYISGSITNENIMWELFDRVKPRIVFHVANPSPHANWATAKSLGIDGTDILLKIAMQCASVDAFVFTSSVNVVGGLAHHNVDESHPLWKPDTKCIPYWKAKTIAEQHVISANSQGLRTVSLRLCMIIGERDPNFVPGMLDSVKRGETSYQIGDNSNLLDTVSAENGAKAHLLAAKALMEPNPARKVDGEAFLITDGNPLPFWDLCRMVFRAAGNSSQPEDATVIPAWLAYAFATILEVLYALFTLGRKPSPLTRLIVGFCTNEFTYNIEKSRTILGYRPVVRTEQVLRESVEWELKRREEIYKKAKLV